MIKIAGVVILAAALMCGSTQSQSIFLDKGERGVFLQGGYLGTSGVNSYELDLGYAFTDRLDIGAGVIHHSAASTVSSNSPLRVSSTSAGQFASAYPVKTGGRAVEFILGLHEAYTKTYAEQQGAWLGFGTSLNLKVRVSNRTDLIFRAGFMRARSDEKTHDNANYGIAVASKAERGNKFSLFVEQESGNGPEIYAVGIGYTWVWRRR